MRVLQPMIAFSGNAPPQLAITRRLLERGHEVTVLAQRAARERVLGTGARFIAFERSFPDMDLTTRESDTMRDWEPRTRIGKSWRLLGVLFAFIDEVALDCRDALEAWEADVVVFDWMMLGAAIAAEQAGLPAAMVVHCPYMLPVKGVPPVGAGLRPLPGPIGTLRDRLLTGLGDRVFTVCGEPVIARTRAQLGLAPLRSWQEQLLGVRDIFVMSSPELDFAGRGRLPRNVRYAGPAFEPHPRCWIDPWPEQEQGAPLVLISFSTSYMDQRGLVQRVLDAVAELPVRALLTLGPALAVESFRLPCNARAVEFVPHRTVLAHAALLVTHAGWQTINAALAEGVPIVCIPDGRDQPDNAARVLACGAGVRASRRVSSNRLRGVIARALADESLREAASAMAVALGRADGAEVVVDELERTLEDAGAPRGRTGTISRGAVPAS